MRDMIQTPTVLQLGSPTVDKMLIDKQLRTLSVESSVMVRY